MPPKGRSPRVIPLDRESRSMDRGADRVLGEFASGGPDKNQDRQIERPVDTINRWKSNMKNGTSYTRGTCIVFCTAILVFSCLFGDYTGAPDLIIKTDKGWERNLEVEDSGIRMIVSGKCLPNKYDDEIYVTFYFKTSKNANLNLQSTHFKIESNRYVFVNFRTGADDSNRSFIELNCKHKDYRKMTTNEILNDLSDRRLIIIVEGIFPNPKAVEIKIDEKSMRKAFGR